MDFQYHIRFSKNISYINLIIKNNITIKKANVSHNMYGNNKYFVLFFIITNIAMDKAFIKNIKNKANFIILNLKNIWSNPNSILFVL